VRGLSSPPPASVNYGFSSPNKFKPPLEKFLLMLLRLTKIFLLYGLGISFKRLEKTIIIEEFKEILHFQY